MKNIIQRNLPLDVHYVVTDKKYIPLSEQLIPCSCHNCGQLIANIATVKSSNGVYNIGFDCMETLLINNSLLSNADVLEYERVKKMIPKIIRAAKKIQETIKNNSQANITGLLFEKPMFSGDEFFPFYWLKNGEQKSRDNDYLKIKEIDFDFLLSTFQNIFPKLAIIKP